MLRHLRARRQSRYTAEKTDALFITTHPTMNKKHIAFRRFFKNLTGAYPRYVTGSVVTDARLDEIEQQVRRISRSMQLRKAARQRRNLAAQKGIEHHGEDRSKK
jgi:hypothetical protein